jgi:hypothetical protein
MFLSAVLFVLFMAGCWLYCLTDAALTPAAEFPGLPKPVWIAVIAVTFVLGAVAWMIARKLWRPRFRPLTPADEYLAAEALARHPASRTGGHPGPSALVGPDDDPEFLRMLDRLISGGFDSSELSTGPYRFVTRSRPRPGDRSDPRRCPRGWNHSIRNHWLRRVGRHAGRGRADDRSTP